MSVIGSIKKLLGTETETSRMFECNECSNLFSHTGDLDKQQVPCPNCGSMDTEVAVGAT